MGGRVVLCQWDLIWEDPQANYAQVVSLVESLGDLSGSLVVLPEMFATGFSMDVARVTDGEPVRSEEFVIGLAARHAVSVLAGFGVPSGPGKGRNVAVAVDPAGRRVAEYTKNQPFSLSREGEHYQAGRGIVTFDWAGMIVCPLICYDLRFPELFRLGVEAGAEMFCVIANWPVRRVEHWITLLMGRAIENQAYVVGVNRCGEDPGFAYPGRSLVIDPHGEIIADAGAGEAVIACPIDPSSVRQWREEFPALRDRRDD